MKVCWAASFSSMVSVSLAGSQLRGSVTGTAAAGAEPAVNMSEDAYLKEPMASTNDRKAEVEVWQNVSTLESAAALGAAFCNSERVGYYCRGFTLMRCSRTRVGYHVLSEIAANSRTCGWPCASHLTAQAEYEEEPSNGPEASKDEDLEVPSELEAEYPKLEIDGSQNVTSLGSSASVQADSCSSHRFGYYCRGFTRVRCCRTRAGQSILCGTVAHYRGCGWCG